MVGSVPLDGYDPIEDALDRASLKDDSPGIPPRQLIDMLGLTDEVQID